MAPSPVRGPAPRATDHPDSAALTVPAQLRRALRGLWWTAALLTAAAYGLRLAVRLWLEPAAVALPERPALSATLAATLLSAGAPLGLYAARVRRHRRPPRTFLLTRVRRPGVPGRVPALAAAPSPWLGVYPIGLGALVAGFVPLTDAADGSRGVGAPGRWFTLVAAGVALAGAGWAARRRPRLTLTPGGLVLRAALPGRTGTVVPWTALEAVPTAAPTGARHLELPLRRTPAGAAPATAPLRASLTWLWIDPAFLAQTIDHYAQHAADRTAIGHTGAARPGAPPRPRRPDHPRPPRRSATAAPWSTGAPTPRESR
ncbi:MAG TPA: hypothetical protein VNV66_15705 [Pilimelia sp.]|nr:hypothetical protein [Pilimelia sp.]